MRQDTAAIIATVVIACAFGVAMVIIDKGCP